MFPEYRDLITQLKSSDAHFQRLFDKHNELDQEIISLESNPAHRDEEVEIKKKEKLLLKDQLYQILKKAETNS